MQQIKPPPTSDPDNVVETLCVGQFNIVIDGPLATITFTHVRNNAAALLDNTTLQPESVVRARIVTTIDNLWALGDAINNIRVHNAAQSVAAISSKPN